MKVRKLHFRKFRPYTWVHAALFLTNTFPGVFGGGSTMMRVFHKKETK